ncbi:MAG: GNAT family N-acetyltransferase [Acidiphilium sp.]|nr:GNAT family N-acetyltransferase [Acidiphilium sp.]MDD4936526.1 GNAT family N-acetyltransferase [Acidiphilium sp.]
MHNSSTLLGRPDLVTEHLLLRRPNEGDLGTIVCIVGDWEVARRLARVPHPYNLHDARFFLEQVVSSEWVWTITMQGSDELIGVVGLTPEEGANTAELGYWLSRAHWGRGIMTEAARAIVSYGFDRLGLIYITSGYFEDNSASGRVLEKLGFLETGRAARPCLAAGCDVPSVEMSLLPLD